MGYSKNVPNALAMALVSGGLMWALESLEHYIAFASNTDLAGSLNRHSIRQLLMGLFVCFLKKTTPDRGQTPLPANAEHRLK